MIHLRIHLNAYFLSAVSASSLEYECYLFFSQLPLHEGRRNRVDPSGSVDLLTGTKREAMGSRFDCHRVRPDYGTLFISIEKGQLLF